MPGMLQEIEVEGVLVPRLISKVTEARGDTMTSWELLYLDRTWVTADDADDAEAPEAACPAEGG